MQAFLWIRRGLLAAAVGALLVCGLGLAFEFLIPSRWWTTQLRSELETDLRRPVRVGKVRWSLWRGFSAENLWVGELPAYGSGTFLEAKLMTARPRLTALVLGRVSLSSAKLVGVKAHIVRDAGGRFNFSDLSTGGSGSTPAIDIRRLDLQDAELDFVDRVRGVHAAAMHLWASLSRLSPNGKPRLEADCRLAGINQEKTLQTAVSLQAEGRLADYVLKASSGKLIFRDIRLPYFNAEELRAEWDLSGLSGDLATVQGAVHLRGLPGHLENPAELTRDSRWADLLLSPVKILARLHGLGLEDMGKIDYDEISGDYAFSAGEAIIHPFFIKGPLVSMETEGSVQLRDRTLRLSTNLTMKKTVVGALVEGPMDAPEVKPHLSFRGVKTQL